MKSLCIVCFMFISGVLSAQEITSQSIHSSGTTFKSSGVSVVSTTGEIVLPQFDSTGMSGGIAGITSEVLTVIPENIAADMDVKIYPNPTSELVYIEMVDHKNTLAELYDVSGKLIHQ